MKYLSVCSKKSGNYCRLSTRHGVDMIEEEAVVTRLDNSLIWIKRLHCGGCSGCLQQSMCGTSVVAKLLPKREFAVDNDF